jgi:uncharacterized protein (TIGR02266 family)
MWESIASKKRWRGGPSVDQDHPMQASLPVSDGRAHRRFSIELEVSLTSDSNFYMGLTQNLSNGGLFVSTHLVKPVGTEVEVTLRVPTSDAPLALRGVVRWVREFQHGEAWPGMGIQFENPSAGDLRVVEDFLATRTPLFFDMA